ncbi:MAG: cation:proton antiporter [Bacilli bacterium]|nr:cation:proton antiporter [Bacilli bacterium]
MEYVHIFGYIALLLLVALLSTRLMRVLKLPNVTGYIITGILMGPFAFGLFFNGFSFEGIEASPVFQFVDRIKWVSTIALGFIAFSIGTSFRIPTLKAVGKKVITITVFESLFASLAVLGALIVAHFISSDQVTWEIVLTLSAIAAATAPAATLMVIKQYNARGPLVDTLLPVVALDDASALILFAILFQIASTIASGNGQFDVYRMVFKPLIEIVLSLGIGAVFGLLISLLNMWFKSRNNRLILCVFAVFAACGVYYLFKAPWMGGFELSSLLMCMMIGAFYANMRKDSGKTLDVMDRFTSPIYLMFFVISGASLDLRVFFNGSGPLVLLVGLTYIVFRVIGKWGGAFTGASISRCEPKIKRYLGFALIPQAGVAIGLATTASTLFGASPNEEVQRAGALIIAIVLTSTLVYELVGPVVSKFALSKAGEIQMQ